MTCAIVARAPSRKVAAVVSDERECRRGFDSRVWLEANITSLSSAILSFVIHNWETGNLRKRHSKLPASRQIGTCRLFLHRFSTNYCNFAYSALACFRDGDVGVGVFSEVEEVLISHCPGFISGSEGRGRRDRRGAHRRWWKGPWKNRKRCHCKSEKIQMGPSTRSGAARWFYRLSMAGGKS